MPKFPTHMKTTSGFLAAFATLTLLPLSAATKVFESFEGDGFGSWTEEGTAFGKAPIPGTTSGLTGELSNYAAEGLACSAHQGDAALGSLTSAEFVIEQPFIAFLIAGGNHPGKTCVQLLIDDKVALEALGKKSLSCEKVNWDVTKWKGKKARLRLLDQETGSWGMIAADHFVFTDDANATFPATSKPVKAKVPGLVTGAVLPGVKIPEGVEAKVMADYQTQKVTSPTALCFDEKGAIYLSETHRFRFGIEDDRNHLYWYLDDLASKTVDDRRKLHEKWSSKLPISKLTEKSEIVRLLVDKDGDGVCETMKVFADGFNDLLDGTAAGVFALEGTVYLASIPKIWALRDTNGDGVAEEKKVIQDGFGVRISLSGHDLNGFALGPDGMIYGTVGDRALSFTTKEGKEYKLPNEGAAFRFEPDGSKFELIHTGLRNPKEIAFDAWGNAISVDNNSDQGDKARVVYLVPGGDSGWQMENQAMHTFFKQIGLDGHPINRWMAERMWEPLNEAQPAYILPPMANLTSGPSGLTYHPGAGFMESEVGRFLICDYRGASAGSGIFSFAVAPDGAGMKLVDSREFNWGVAATDVEYSYDGKLVVADFKGGWESHEDGRVYSLSAGANTYKAEAAKQTSQWMAEGFAQRSTAELAGMLKHADMRVRLRAQIELTRRPDGLPALEKAIVSDNEFERLHGIWGVGIIARRGVIGKSTTPGFAPVPDGTKIGKAVEILNGLLGHADAEVRAQSLKMLADVTTVSLAKLPLAKMLKDDSPRVRFFAAIVVAKSKAAFLAPQILELLEENNDKDPFLRHAGAYALQNILPEQQFNALRSVTNPSVKLAIVVALRRMKSPLLEGYVDDENPRVADEAIRAIHDQFIESCRPAVAQLLDKRDGVKRSEMMWRRIIHSAFRCGGDVNAARLLTTAADPQVPQPVREEALRLMATWAKPFPVDQSIGYWAPLPDRDPAALQKVLSKGLPPLIKAGGPIMTKALGLMETYQIKLEGMSPADLQVMVDSTALPSAARAKALQIFIEGKPADADAALARWAKDADPLVASASLTEITRRNPALALEAITANLAKGDLSLSQSAWTLLAKVPGDKAAAVIVEGMQQLTTAKGNLPFAIELLETAKARKEKSVVQAVTAWEKSLPADDPLASWTVALQGGDAQRGEKIYLSHPAECMRCHRAGEGHEAGGEAGPNLAGIATRGDLKYLLEAMIVPSAKVSPGFGIVSATLRNNTVVAGIMLEETKETIDIDVGDKISRVKRSDIKEMTAPVSAMPPMSALLKPREARDLLAWLSTLKKPAPVKKSDKKVVPVLISRINPHNPDSLWDDSPTKTFFIATAEPKDAASSEVKTASTPVLEAKAPEVAAVSEEVMKAGKAQFALCQACHGPDGGGVANVAPPLAGSEWVIGPPENLIRIQLRGLQGPIKVKGVEYSLMMPPQAYQSDEQIASVLSYVRNSFGNKASAIGVDQVKALRGEVGKPMLTGGELIPPPPLAAKPDAGSAAAKAANVSKPTLQKNSLSTNLGLPLWALALLVGWVGFCVIAGLVKHD